MSPAKVSFPRPAPHLSSGLSVGRKRCGILGITRAQYDHQLGLCNLVRPLSGSSRRYPSSPPACRSTRAHPASERPRPARHFSASAGSYVSETFSALPASCNRHSRSGRRLGLHHVGDQDNIRLWQTGTCGGRWKDRVRADKAAAASHTITSFRGGSKRRTRSARAAILYQGRISNSPPVVVALLPLAVHPAACCGARFVSHRRRHRWRAPAPCGHKDEMPRRRDARGHRCC